MVTTEMTYICDCCGRKSSKPIDISASFTYEAAKYPDGWELMIDPFGLCCDHCMNAFMNVYDSLRR